MELVEQVTVKALPASCVAAAVKLDKKHALKILGVDLNVNVLLAVKHLDQFALAVSGAASLCGKEQQAKEAPDKIALN